MAARGFILYLKDTYPDTSAAVPAVEDRMLACWTI
jgi:hypothetical protein